MRPYCCYWNLYWGFFLTYILTLFIEETKIYTTVYKYVFKNNIKYYPVFLLKTEGVVYDMRLYATDEFKDFIEYNGITGLRFEEIFDFDD